MLAISLGMKVRWCCPGVTAETAWRDGLSRIAEQLAHYQEEEINLAVMFRWFSYIGNELKGSFHALRRRAKTLRQTRRTKRILAKRPTNVRRAGVPQNHPSGASCKTQQDTTPPAARRMREQFALQALNDLDFFRIIILEVQGGHKKMFILTLAKLSS